MLLLHVLQSMSDHERQIKRRLVDLPDKEENMIRKAYYHTMIGFVLWSLLGLFSPAANSAPYKVLVVMSYDEIYPWVREVKEGIDSELRGTCKIKYFYMDTKRKIEGGPQKAKEAYALYRAFQPDGVIAADDNAQSMFVVPYLKDKVKTPVMFCGVNAEAAAYGYPALNVSGILERLHISETIAFVKQLVPEIKTIGYILKESPSGNAILRQVQSEEGTYAAKFIAFRMPKTLKEAVLMTEGLKKSCDVLFMETMEGIPGYDGKPLTDKEVVPIVAKTFGKPLIGANLYHVKNGMLCAVTKMGQEQGSTAAIMLLKAMQGTPVSQIPITRNRHGKAVINVTVMKAFGIKPRPILLKGTELVRTED